MAGDGQVMTTANRPLDNLASRTATRRASGAEGSITNPAPGRGSSSISISGSSMGNGRPRVPHPPSRHAILCYGVVCGVN